MVLTLAKKGKTYICRLLCKKVQNERKWVFERSIGAFMDENRPKIDRIAQNVEFYGPGGPCNTLRVIS
jgi:hypothetical protein